MATITGAIEIDCPVEEVFDFVADERNEPMYNPLLLHSTKTTSGRIGMGTRFAAAHRTHGKPAELTIEITGYDRPHRLVSHTTMPGCEVDGELTFEPLGGRTRLRWNWIVQPKHAKWLAGPVLRLVGNRQEHACWKGLKRLLEEQSSARRQPGITATGHVA